jgi:hypothetical protein
VYWRESSRARFPGRRAALCRYGGIGPVGQYLYYANSTDGLAWTKPDLNRYDLGEKWPEPWAKQIGKQNNIIMYGGGLGILHDLHDPDPSQRYKISGGAPAGCYSDDGSTNCVVATAGSPDGINNWTRVAPLAFAPPWRPDCHTNVVYDTRNAEYRMTTRDYTATSGRDIAIAVSGGGGGGGGGERHWTGNWSLLHSNTYPPSTEASGHGCARLTLGPHDDAVTTCGAHCRSVNDCAFFWVYTAGADRGTCCPKAAVLPGKLMPPACPSCGGAFYQMDGKPTVTPPSPPSHNASVFGDWGDPTIVATGDEDHQLYSQITFPFYDVYLGIVMVYDATNGNVGPAAGHVHCRLAWSADGLTEWQWASAQHATSHNSSDIPEFIPAGELGEFDSHICFAAHLPIQMPDGECVSVGDAEKTRFALHRAVHFFYFFYFFLHQRWCSSVLRCQCDVDAWMPLPRAGAARAIAQADGRRASFMCVCSVFPSPFRFLPPLLKVRSGFFTWAETGHTAVRGTRALPWPRFARMDSPALGVPAALSTRCPSWSRGRRW